ncbi:MAG TPA: di-heme oxidoredictase family protein [Terriglobia bacterium]|nr:di-heme oxidoredictase family protein [Terriglobia bacterium]
MVQHLKSAHKGGKAGQHLKAIGPLAGLALAAAVLGLVGSQVLASGSLAVDPGVRGGTAGAGGFVTGLTTQQAQVGTDITPYFSQVNNVPEPADQSSPGGLGPRFNSNSCASCHAQPAIGGASPLPASLGGPGNPLFNVYQLMGAQNTMPSFETTSGPVLVPLFPFESDLITPDGYVHQLFTITGRTDAGSCSIAQPNFTQAMSQNNLVFRQPIATFGDGLIEIIQNVDIINNLNANLTQKAALGIIGTPNIASDGSVSRLGWKAQMRSLVLAAAIEYNVEEGVTSEFFPNELDETPGCVLNPVPESYINYNPSIPPYEYPGDPDRFAIYMRFLAAPVPGACPGGVQSSCTNGSVQFNSSNVGCALCHTKSFTTPKSIINALGQKKATLYSDLLVHHMGPCLADNITQGNAAGDEFRTAPLWGVGQRAFFLHDGRTSDIVQAIEDHLCTGNSQYPNSEANASVTAFNALPQKNQQDLVNFLRSL